MKFEKLKIENAVKEAEKNTSGEIVPAVLKSSDSYPGAHFRAALIFGILPAILSYAYIDFEDPLYYIVIQFPGMIFGYLLAYIPFIKKLLSTKAEMQEEVYQRALQVFYESGVSGTRDRTGILIFVSLLEKRVEVLADSAISEKVGKDYWNNLVNDLLLDIKRGDLTTGLEKAVKKCGSSLTTHFPIKSDDTNELSNKVVTE